MAIWYFMYSYNLASVEYISWFLLVLLVGKSHISFFRIHIMLQRLANMSPIMEKGAFQNRQTILLKWQYVFVVYIYIIYILHIVYMCDFTFLLILFSLYMGKEKTIFYPNFFLSWKWCNKYIYLGVYAFVDFFKTIHTQIYF